MKSLPIIFLAVSITGAFIYFGLEKGRTDSTTRVPVETMTLNQSHFYKEIVEKISTASNTSRFPGKADRSLSEWLEQSTSAANDGGGVATQDLLEQLSHDIPQISSATACIAYSSDLSSLKDSIADWAEGIEPEFNQFATHLFADPSSQQIGCAAVAIERLRRFSPESVNSGKKSFYSICRLCDRAHIGTIEQTNGAAALTCPQCHGSYELLAFKLDGKVCRVNKLLQGWTPPVKVPTTSSRVEEMVYIWKAVLKHVRYAEDLQGVHTNLDTWQLASETWKYKNGDCEDSSILLADWLIARGFDARVVIGITDEQVGHAWCVVSLDGASYILETTDAKPDLRRLPYAAKLRKRYIPKYQFNREAVFYRKNNAEAPRYWSSTSWRRLAAE